MLCPCCGNEISLAAFECACGARFVGEPVNEALVKVPRLGPVMMATMMLLVVIAGALIITKYLAFAGVLVIWSSRRAMRLARSEPAAYGGLRVATATLVVSVAACAVAASFAVAHIPRFLENRQIKQTAATQASIYHVVNILEAYKHKYGSYPPNDLAIRKVINESLPADYWMHTIEYHSYTEAIADRSPTASLPIANFELRSAGPDEKMGTDDDIIMRDGVFLPSDEVVKRSIVQGAAPR